MKQYFAIIYTPGPAQIDGSVEPLPFLSQISYMERLRDEGVLVLAGAYMDPACGMLVVKAENPEAVQAVVKNHPAVQQGIFNTQVQPWYIDLEPAS